MKTVRLSEVTDRFSELIAEVETTHEAVQIRRRGSVAAVLVDAGEWEAMQETLRLLSAAGASEELAQTLADYAAGSAVPGDEARRRFGLQPR